MSGFKLHAEEVGREIRDREKDEEISYGVLDPSAFAEDGGPSIAERMGTGCEGQGVVQAGRQHACLQAQIARQHERLGQMRARLVGNDDGHAMMVLFSTCVDSIRTIPFLQHDPDRLEDVMTDSEDQAATMRRYACMSRPWVPVKRSPSRRTSAATRRCTGTERRAIGEHIDGMTRMPSAPRPSSNGSCRPSRTILTFAAKAGVPQSVGEEFAAADEATGQSPTRKSRTLRIGRQSYEDKQWPSATSSRSAAIRRAAPRPAAAPADRRRRRRTRTAFGRWKSASRPTRPISTARRWKFRSSRTRGAIATARSGHRDQIKTFNDRKQPVVTYNKIGRKIDGIVGLVERLKQDPKAYPRTPQHQQGADLATAVLRYLMDRNKWNEVAPLITEAARGRRPCRHRT